MEDEKIPARIVDKFLNKNYSQIEAQRISKAFALPNNAAVSYAKLHAKFMAVLERDLQYCIKLGFRRLDHYERHSVSTLALKKAVKCMMRLQQSKRVYHVLQDMNRKIDRDYPADKYDEAAFTNFIKTGLKPSNELNTK